MKYILKLVIGILVSIILLYVLFPIVLGLIIFNDSRLEELDVDYSRVIAALKPYDRYDLHVKPLEGGKKIPSYLRREWIISV